MKTKNSNNGASWCDLVEPYHGQWVALTRDGKEVVSHSKSREMAVKQARERGVEIPFIVKSPFDY